MNRLGTRKTERFKLQLFFLVLLSLGASAAAQDDSQLPSAPEPNQQNPQQPSDEKKDEGASPTKMAGQAVDVTKKVGVMAWVKARDWESRWFTGVFVAHGQTMTPLNGAERQQLYLSQTLTTPGPYLKRAFSAGFDQARGAPSEWGGGWGGYGKRFASHEGQFIAANSIAALGNAALKYEPRYDRCQCKKFLARTRHAIVRNFMTFNETEVERRPQIGLYAGAFGGGMISAAWKPRPVNPFVQGAWGVVGQAGYGTLLNFFIEFAGEINRKIGSNQPAPTY